MTDTVYLSFADAPLDQPDFDDGDDSLLGLAPWANPNATSTRELAAATSVDRLTRALFSPPAPAARIVPHPRDLKRGMVGMDVLALQRAAAKAGLRRWGVGFTGQFGRGLRDQVKTFQRKQGLVVDGVYGASTHRKMAPYYDAYGIHLINLVKVRTPAQMRQAKLLSAAMILYNRRGIVHYSQGPARMSIVRHRWGLADLERVPQIWEDCSSSVTGIYRVAGLADPNGPSFDFNGYGYTGTLCVEGVPISTSDAHPGALHFYGGGFPYGHVTMSVGGGRCFSHGSEAGPKLADVHYRADLRQTRSYPGLP